MKAENNHDKLIHIKCTFQC